MSSGQNIGSLNPGGSPAPAASNSIPLAQAQDIALRISTCFEGGKSMNYQALADNFDGQGTSFGLIQWNFGSGTLGPLLKQMLQADDAAFAGCFGSNTNYDSLKSAIASGSVANQMSWVLALLQANRPAWKEAFTALGTNDKFNLIQKQQAIDHYHGRAVIVIANLRRISPALMGNVEVRSYLAIFDLCVQQNGIDKVLDAIKATVATAPPATQVDLVKIAAEQRALVAKAAFVADCMSRRLGILAGKVVSFTANGVTSTRQNPQLALIGDLGTKFVAGL